MHGHVVRIRIVTDHGRNLIGHCRMWCLAPEVTWIRSWEVCLVLYVDERHERNVFTLRIPGGCDLLAREHQVVIELFGRQYGYVSDGQALTRTHDTVIVPRGFHFDQRTCNSIPRRSRHRSRTTRGWGRTGRAAAAGRRRTGCAATRAVSRRSADSADGLARATATKRDHERTHDGTCDKT